MVKTAITAREILAGIGNRSSSISLPTQIGINPLINIHSVRILVFALVGFSLFFCMGFFCQIRGFSSYEVKRRFVLLKMLFPIEFSGVY